MLTGRGATVTICHIDTIDTKKYCLKADLIFTCCGVGQMIKKNWIKEGCSIVDIGITVRDCPFSNKKIVVGDCDFEDVKEKVKYITPVPGGIGPVTIYTLLEQLVSSCEMLNY
jgi:methylenetetrahydrofolate dehydrogenase (NADP+)/methenyltetrahydrofolate cyclohydrolase